MIDPDVRLATIADVEQLTSLESEARQAAGEMRGGQRWLATHAPVDWSVRVEHGDVSVGEIDSVIVGLLVLAVDASVARVELVFVTQQARELGFGDALLELAIARAHEASATVIEAEALPGDRDTKNLYERAGVTARLLTLSRTI